MYMHVQLVRIEKVPLLQCVPLKMSTVMLDGGRERHSIEWREQQKI